jgi:hypothetical protein
MGIRRSLEETPKARRTAKLEVKKESERGGRIKIFKYMLFVTFRKLFDTICLFRLVKF